MGTCNRVFSLTLTAFQFVQLQMGGYGNAFGHAATHRREIAHSIILRSFQPTWYHAHFRGSCHCSSDVLLVISFFHSGEEITPPKCAIRRNAHNALWSVSYLLWSIKVIRQNTVKESLANLLMFIAHNCSQRNPFNRIYWGFTTHNSSNRRPRWRDVCWASLFSVNETTKTQLPYS